MNEIWYAKELKFGLKIEDMNIDVKDLSKTHIKVGETEEKDLNKIFAAFQGENWSPKEYLQSIGMQRTSMCGSIGAWGSVITGL